MSIGWWLQAVGGSLAVLGALLGLLGFLLSPKENIVSSLKKVMVFQTHSGFGDNVAGNKIVNEIKKYSSAQTIKLGPSQLGGNDFLNLDNVAVLSQVGGYNLNEITLGLDLPVREIPNPGPGNNSLPVGDVTVVVNPNNNPGFQFEDFQVAKTNSAKQYSFNLDTLRKQRIRVQGKTFIVKLNKISKQTIPQVSLALQYDFGIIEA